MLFTYTLVILFAVFLAIKMASKLEKVVPPKAVPEAKPRMKLRKAFIRGNLKEEEPVELPPKKEGFWRALHREISSTRNTVNEINNQNTMWELQRELDRQNQKRVYNFDSKDMF